MLSRVRAAAALGTFCCTGEGGYPDELKPYDDHIITQVATGLFGVREETIKRVRIVEFKAPLDEMRTVSAMTHWAPVPKSL